MPFNINDILSKLRKKKDGKKSAVASQQTVEKAEKEREKRLKNAPRNPFLDARSEWNNVNGSVLASRQAWMVTAILALLVTFASVAGMIYVGSQSKIMPFVVEVDKAGTVIGGGTVDMNPKASDRVKQAFVASFITQARMVTPDSSLQRKALDFVFAVMRPTDPAGVKLTEYYNATPQSNPFARAEKEMVDVQITSVIAASESTWEVEWIETSRGRDGAVLQRQQMRALVTVATDPSRITNNAEMRRNPLALFVTDVSWSPRQL